MAEKDRASKAAMAVSVSTAIAVAFALLAKRAQAAPIEPGQVVSLDEATMNLLIAIAQASGDIDSNTEDALTKLQEIIERGKASLTTSLEEIQQEFANRQDMMVKPSAGRK